MYREPSLSLEQIRVDLPLLKKLGFNMIKVQECWANDEKQEGVIDLAKVAQIVSDASDCGLWVDFGLTMELAARDLDRDPGDTEPLAAADCGPSR